MLNTQKQQPNYKLSISFIITILFLLIPPSLNQQCKNCIKLSYYHCTVCYNNCTDIQSQQFQYCQWSYCTFLGINTTSNCFNYQIANLSQNQCYRKCCNSNQTYFTIDSLNKCSQLNTLNIALIIATTVTVTGICLIIGVCCLVRRWMGWSCGCFRCCQQSYDGVCNRIGNCLCYIFTCACFRNNNNSNVSNRNVRNTNNVNYSNQWFGRNNSSRQLNNHQLSQNQQLKWQQQIGPNQTILNNSTSCIICLNNDVNTVTSCNHYYHIQCIMEWFIHNTQCPLCKNKKDINQVKYYCTRCAKNYIKINLYFYDNYIKIIQDLNKMKCQICIK